MSQIENRSAEYQHKCFWIINQKKNLIQSHLFLSKHF